MKKKLFSIVLVLMLIVSYLPTSVAASTSLSGKKICVDAGHGGSDTGAIGTLGLFNGTTTVYEKDFTLTFALELAKELENKGAEVYMIRNNDTYVHVNDRWQRATAQNVNAYISLHFDWDGAPNGILSMYGATRPQDRSFSKMIHSGIMQQVPYYNDRGVLDDTYSGMNSVAVLRYGGSYPRTLIEINNMDYSDMQGFELLIEATRFARGISNGLENYF